MIKRLLPLLAVALSVGACTDGNVLRPADDGGPLVPSPSFALVDAASGGDVPGFYFLPPLAKSPSIEGSFDPNLSPAMSVCELDGNPSASVNPDWATVACTGTIAAYFPPGSAAVGDALYAWGWDTDASPENVTPMDPDGFYRIHVLLQDAVLGYLDINPQRPSGDTPGEDYPDLYAFRLGENLPIKVFLSPAARCATAEEYVIQCTASAVLDQTGGVLSLNSDEPGWSKLSVVLSPDALPAGVDQVTLTIERIDPALFAAANGGQACIPMFDAPQFADCLRVTSDPILETPLTVPANVEMCIAPGTLPVTPSQQGLLQIIRYNDQENVWQGLPTVDATTCPPLAAPSPSQVGLLPVPREKGFMRLAAIGVNHVARFLGPEPLAALGEIRLAGATSNFSRFRWALPGEMLKTAGDGTVIQQAEDQSEDYNVPVTVTVVDAVGDPVTGATVHFSNGTVATTSTNGLASTTWTVSGSVGEHTFTASALGLLDVNVPGNETLIEFTPATVTFTATVVGPPSSYQQTPTEALTGAPGETLDTPLTITVFDENDLPVTGWSVTWGSACDGFECTAGDVSGDTETDASGSASATWTLSTTPGGNTATATVGGLTATWHADGVCQVTIDGIWSENEWSCGGTASFTASVSGGDAPAEVYWQNDGTSLYLAVRIQQSSLDKINSVRFDFNNDDAGAPEEGDDAIGYEAGGLGFFDEYLTLKCANNGQSGCGAVDAVSQDGAGAIGNDGQWTVYELSHPLQGTPGEDFIRSAGDPLGFFLTLRIGKGAQGNTQWPGFRDFHGIVIR